MSLTWRTKSGFCRAAPDFLAPGGFLVVADITFPTTAVRAAAAERWATWWDEDEFYWAADEANAACAEVGLPATYQQVSICAGVFTVTVANGRAGQPEQAVGLL